MLHLSTKARYATRALIELAMHNDNGPLKLRIIAEKQGISLKYLEQVMFPLNTNGITKTKKGHNGGYLLARDPKTINLYQIISTVEGPPSPTACVDNPDVCEKHEHCVTRDIWCHLKDVIAKELQDISLADLAYRKEQMP